MENPNEIIVDEANEAVSADPRPWGFWVTMGFSILIGMTFLFWQIFIPIVWIVLKKTQNPGMNISKYSKSLEANGFLMSVVILFAGVVTGAVVLLFAKFKPGISLKQYFKFNPISLKTVLIWLGVLVVYIVIIDLTSYAVKGEIVPEVMHKQYESAGFLPLLLFSVIVIAPLFEELFFRGFLFEGIRCSRLGNIGAIFFTSLFWSAIHVQYDFFGICTIFAGSIVLGIAKIKTNSLYTTIMMHSVMNIIATTECIIINEFLR